MDPFSTEPEPEKVLQSHYRDQLIYGHPSEVQRESHITSKNQRKPKQTKRNQRKRKEARPEQKSRKLKIAFLQPNQMEKATGATATSHQIEAARPADWQSGACREPGSVGAVERWRGAWLPFDENQTVMLLLFVCMSAADTLRY